MSKGVATAAAAAARRPARSAMARARCSRARPSGVARSSCVVRAVLAARLCAVRPVPAKGSCKQRHRTRPCRTASSGLKQTLFTRSGRVQNHCPGSISPRSSNCRECHSNGAELCQRNVWISKVICRGCASAPWRCGTTPPPPSGCCARGRHRCCIPRPKTCDPRAASARPWPGRTKSGRSCASGRDMFSS